MWSFVLFCSAWYCAVGCEEGGGAWCGVVWSFVLFCSALYCAVGCEEGGGAWCGVLCCSAVPGTVLWDVRRVVVLGVEFCVVLQCLVLCCGV